MARQLLIRRGELPRFLQFHLRFAADYIAIAAFGAEHAAAACLASVTFAKLVGHRAVLRDRI